MNEILSHAGITWKDDYKKGDVYTSSLWEILGRFKTCYEAGHDAPFTQLEKINYNKKEMKQDIEVASIIERDKVIQELHVAYKIHKDAKHYIISSAAIQEYAVPLFKAGAEWQSKQMAWISVNDKMPEDGHIIDDLTIYSHTKNVIVLYNNGCIGKGKRIYVNRINKKGWQWSCLKGEDITHWMYFPY